VRLAWTDRALLRVEETARYIAADDPAAAVRWASELFDAVERLADFPESGRLARSLKAAASAISCIAPTGSSTGPTKQRS